jgi:pyrroloquinoline quinone (PQQ) biosynthesis protein C
MIDVVYPARLGAVGAKVTSLFAAQKIETHPLFQALANPAASVAQRAFMALQIYHVVRCFPRFLAAMVSNLEELGDRMPLVENLLEEHGHLDPAKAHVQSYLEFLARQGIPETWIKASKPIAPVVAYNRAVLDLCARQHPLEGLAALGVIEDVVARVSPIVTALSVPAEQRGDFFDEHAALDIGHAIELYELVVPHYAENAARIDLGLELGLYYHAGMYEAIARAAGNV